MSIFSGTSCVSCRPTVKFYHPGTPDTPTPMHQPHSKFKLIEYGKNYKNSRWDVWCWDAKNPDLGPHFVFYREIDGKVYCFADCAEDHIHSIKIFETLLEVLLGREIP